MCESVSVISVVRPCLGRRERRASCHRGGSGSIALRALARLGVIRFLRIHIHADLAGLHLDIRRGNPLIVQVFEKVSLVGLQDAHLAPLGDYESDHAAVALRFLGAPYLWGGKTSIGLDCSGLIQLSLGRCGRDVARDSDMQAASIGEAVEYSGDEAVLKRGDLVFWRGHAGIWIDPARFVHANATDMMVAVAPLAEIAARIETTSGETVSTVRRP